MANNHRSLNGWYRDWLTGNWYLVRSGEIMVVLSEVRAGGAIRYSCRYWDQVGLTTPEFSNRNLAMHESQLRAVHELDDITDQGELLQGFLDSADMDRDFLPEEYIRNWDPFEEEAGA